MVAPHSHGEERDVLANIWPNQPVPRPPSTIDGSGSHVVAGSTGAVSLRPSPHGAELAAVEESAASRSATVFARWTLVASRGSTELLVEEIETTDGALVLTTAEELEEQWLTMTDCTDECER